MDKNTQILFFIGFILLCLYLSCKNKEGFVVINKRQFDEQCSEGHECIVTQSGASGFICSENANSGNYNIVGGGNGVTIFSDPFNLSLRADQPCNSVNADPDPAVDTPLVSACTSSDSPYELSGCISKCTKPTSSDIYNLNSAPNKIENSTDPIENQDITCNDGFVPAENICFHKDTGAINPNRNQGDCVGSDNIWYDGAQGVKTYCPSPGEDYVIMGCEPTCLSRISHQDDYLMTVGESIRSVGSLEINYQRGKELMQVTPHRTETTIGLIRPLETSPYNVDESGSSLDPNNFSVNITPVSAHANNNVAGDIDFEGTGVSEACNINSEDEVTRNKYYVKGLFPTCGDDEECLNFNISYNEGEDKPYTLEQLRDLLPTDIFQGNPSEEDIQKYKDSLYYFRGFMGSDGRYNVEGQIRCNTDSTSRYGCAILNEIPETGETTVEAAGGGDYTWVLGTLGENCTDTCTGADLTCSGEDTGDRVPWGVNDEDSFRVAMTAATAATGGSFEETCTRLYAGYSEHEWVPGVNHSGSCQHQPAGTPSVCSGHNMLYQRLCRCIDG